MIEEFAVDMHDPAIKPCAHSGLSSACDSCSAKRSRDRAYGQSKTPEWWAKWQERRRYRYHNEMTPEQRRVRVGLTPLKKQLGHYERRMRKMNAGKFEKISLDEIGERDGWVCQLCGLPCPRATRPYKHSGQSPSLDHIVALSRGGSHTRENLQLAHVTCNARKSASLVWSKTHGTQGSNASFAVESQA